MRLKVHSLSWSVACLASGVGGSIAYVEHARAQGPAAVDGSVGAQDPLATDSDVDAAGDAAGNATSNAAGNADKARAETDTSPEILAAAFAGRRVAQVDVIGNARTRTSFILRRLDVAVGGVLSPSVVERSVQNLKNTKLFKSIKIDFTPRGADEVVVRLTLDELWTTIPVLLFSTGGGSVLILAGMVEANLFGYGAVSYLTYQYLDGTNTWTGQVKHPDFFDTGFELMPYFLLEEKNNEIRTYDSERALRGGYTSHQDTYGITVRRPFELGLDILPMFSPGLGARYSKWRFSERELSDEAREANAKERYALPSTTERIYGSAEAQFGRVDFDGNLARGATVLYRYTSGSPIARSSGPYSEQFINARLFHTFPGDTLLAARYEWQRRLSPSAGDEDMLGGLFHVRGLPNDVFRGLTLWILNVEARRVVRKQRYIHWQVVAFTDHGDTGRTRTHPGVRNHRPDGAAHSVGGGFRVLFPDISELAVRVDYGWLLSPFKASGLSLGLVQFVR
jgi:hypothetical protein